MSWLLFLDESGHDRRSMPYEVRGGIALHAAKLWSFVQNVQRLELECFGCRLGEYGKEIKGSRLLDKDRFRWAAQGASMEDGTRRQLAKRFFDKGVRQEVPAREEFTAYGQACLLMAEGVFQLLREHEARLFVGVIPRESHRPPGPEPGLLRKDQVFLLERYFYFLEQKRDHGLLVLDESEKDYDRHFIDRVQSYFQRTQTGRHRTAWIVPMPLLVSSDLVPPVQAADLCIYCVNWGFRLPHQGMNEPVREEIATAYGPWIKDLEFHGDAYKDGAVFRTHGIVYVPDPYGPRA